MVMVGPTSVEAPCVVSLYTIWPGKKAEPFNLSSKITLLSSSTHVRVQPNHNPSGQPLRLVSAGLIPSPSCCYTAVFSLP